MQYFGEVPCHGIYKSGPKKGLQCKGPGYFKNSQNQQTYCGVHCPREYRIQLPKHPNRTSNRQRQLQNEKDEAERYAKDNLSRSEKGSVILRRMKMMQATPVERGFIKIFPNYNHGSVRDGIGMPSLSPKAMGPVDHGQPGLPVAKCIENYHQANKVFPREVDPITQDPLPSWYQKRLEFYHDTVPHRHKFPGAPNAPLYSIHLDSDGVEKRYGYVDSRKFYCRQYEKLAETAGTQSNDDLIRLRKLIEDGWNLQICGYDAYGFPDTGDNVLDHKVAYNDPTSPYGHEKVLHALLVLSPEEYPWRCPQVTVTKPQKINVTVIKP